MKGKYIYIKKTDENYRVFFDGKEIQIETKIRNECVLAEFKENIKIPFVQFFLFNKHIWT